MHPIIARLETNPARIFALTQGVDHEQARWRPGPEAWSILEVVNHLYDEEQFDFRVRIDYILNHPGQEPPPIDPQGWVTERHYNERDLAASLQNYLDERAHSLAWLRSLSAPAWNAVYQAPWGSIRAGDILAAWAAHDLLHMRQLIELHYAATEMAGSPYTLHYAGGW